MGVLKIFYIVSRFLTLLLVHNWDLCTYSCTEFAQPPLLNVALGQVAKTPLVQMSFMVGSLGLLPCCLVVSAIKEHGSRMRARHAKANGGSCWTALLWESC